MIEIGTLWEFVLPDGPLATLAQSTTWGHTLPSRSPRAVVCSGPRLAISGPVPLGHAGMIPASS